MQLLGVARLRKNLTRCSRNQSERERAAEEREILNCKEYLSVSADFLPHGDYPSIIFLHPTLTPLSDNYPQATSLSEMLRSVAMVMRPNK